MGLRQQLGVLRSRVLYYRNPFHVSKLKKFYGQFINPGDLCFDIGAHLGNRTNAWLKMGAKVIALEPQPQCLEFITKKFGQNSNATILPKAVSDSPGKTTFYISSLTPTISTLADEEWKQVMTDKSSFKVEWDDEIEVEVTTLDELISDYGLPTFCKIDVEGLEYQVLKGLNQPIRMLSLEYLSDTAPTEVINCIEKLEGLSSYLYNWSHAESLKLESDSWIDAQTMKNKFSNIKPTEPSGDIYARLID